jgi:hypothetical protein
VDTIIRYMYRPPDGDFPEDGIPIATKYVDPAEAMNLHVAGEPITLQPENTEELGEEPREYQVQYIMPVLAQTEAQSGATPAVTLVVVTDPDA